jgi:hypothetical protein
MKRITYSAAAAIVFAAGCGHGHEVRAGAAPAFQRAEERQADAIVAWIRRYLEAGGDPKTLTDLETRLSALIEADEARRIAARAVALAEDAADPGRAARVQGSAELVEKLAARILEAAEIKGAPGTSRIALDRPVLAAALRALKVDVLAMEREED